MLQYQQETNVVTMTPKILICLFFYLTSQSFMPSLPVLPLALEINFGAPQSLFLRFYSISVALNTFYVLMTLHP